MILLRAWEVFPFAHRTRVHQTTRVRNLDQSFMHRAQLRVIEVAAIESIFGRGGAAGLNRSKTRAVGRPKTLRREWSFEAARLLSRSTRGDTVDAGRRWEETCRVSASRSVSESRFLALRWPADAGDLGEGGHIERSNVDSRTSTLGGDSGRPMPHPSMGIALLEATRAMRIVAGRNLAGATAASTRASIGDAR
jgi:hypothetical protein